LVKSISTCFPAGTSQLAGSNLKSDRVALITVALLEVLPAPLQAANANAVTKIKPNVIKNLFIDFPSLLA
jgi:hypothetical protein